MKLIDRMIFGTARLAGGGCARASRQLIEDSCAAGLTRFDTAPPYGMGAAEGLLGEVLAGETAAEIHTKAGLPQPSVAALRGWGKRLRSGFMAGQTAEWQPTLLDYCTPALTGQFDATQLKHSIERSHRLLRRDRLDLLLLHGAEPEDVTADAWQIFETAKESGTATAIGFAHSGPIKNDSSDNVVQIAPRENDFGLMSDSPRIFHSVRTGVALALASGGSAAEKLKAVRSKLPRKIDSSSAELLAGVALLASHHPENKVIFATTSRTRLSLILAEAAAIDLAELSV